MRVVLGDFGFCTLLYEKNQFIEKAEGGTRLYLAPEQAFKRIDKDHVHYKCTEVGTASDIWAIGVVAYVMLFKQYPLVKEVLELKFPSIARSHVGINMDVLDIDLDVFYQEYLDLLKKCKGIPLAGMSASKECIDFFQACFQWEMEDRWTAEELASHPFIKRE